MSDSPSNTIENNTITGNNIAIVFGGASDGNILINNKITLNKWGLDVSVCGNKNHIYNNNFNNTVNVNFGSNVESNNWNTTKTSRTNIIGGLILVETTGQHLQEMASLRQTPMPMGMAYPKSRILSME